MTTFENISKTSNETLIEAENLHKSVNEISNVLNLIKDIQIRQICLH